METKKGRYEGLRPNPHKLGVITLAEGEDSVRVYVRGEETAMRWFAALSIAERGQLVEQLYQETK